MAELNIAAIREALTATKHYAKSGDPYNAWAQAVLHIKENAPEWLTQLCDAVEAKDAQVEALDDLREKYDVAVRLVDEFLRTGDLCTESLNRCAMLVEDLPLCKQEGECDE